MEDMKQSMHRIDYFIVFVFPKIDPSGDVPFFLMNAAAEVIAYGTAVIIE